MGRVWQNVRRGIRKELHRGAWIANTVTGARARYDRHYYSRGAKALADSGFAVIGATDRIRYELDAT